MRGTQRQLGIAKLMSLLIALTVSADSAADSSALGVRYSNPRYAFELTIPPLLKEISSAESPAALVLHSIDGGYPTFNVIVSAQSGRPDPHGLSEQGERVLQDYHRIGLLDARLLSQAKENISGGKASVFTLEYSASAERFKALVALLPGRRFQYLLTFIDKSARFDEAPGLRQSILDSFRSSDVPVVGPVGKTESSAWYYFLLAGALLCLTFLSALAFRSRRRTIPN